MKYKKAAESMFWMLAMIVVTLTVLLIVSGVFTKLFGQSATEVGRQIDSAGDFDNDGVINIQDKCPCNVRGSVEYDGCDSDSPTEEQKKNDCISKK